MIPFSLSLPLYLYIQYTVDVLKDIYPNVTSAGTWVEFCIIECIFLYSTENYLLFWHPKKAKHYCFLIKYLIQVFSESR